MKRKILLSGIFLLKLLAALVIGIVIVGLWFVFKPLLLSEANSPFKGHPTTVECTQFDRTCSGYIFRESRYHQKKWLDMNVKNYSFTFTNMDHFCMTHFRVTVKNSLVTKYQKIGVTEIFGGGPNDTNYCGGTNTEVTDLEIDPSITILDWFPSITSVSSLQGMSFHPRYHIPLEVSYCPNEETFCMHGEYKKLDSFNAQPN